MATAYDPENGRNMEIWADTPGIQFYTVNTYDDDLLLKGGAAPMAQQAFCLEPGCYPDAPGKENFPFKFLRPEEKYESKFEYRFTAK
jgi:aldose 1-epimerase